MGNGWTGVLSSQALGPDLLPNMRISPNLTQPVPPRRHAMSSLKAIIWHSVCVRVCVSHWREDMLNWKLDAHFSLTASRARMSPGVQQAH